MEGIRERRMPEIIHNRFSLLRARRRGVALLMVLLIVMAITIISMGFIARSDVELGCGGNMLLRMQMDQLAQSGLEHAKGLAVRPPHDLQGCSSFSLIEQQLMVAQSCDFYDVDVVRDASDYCTYNLSCEAYRLHGAEKIGMSRLSAQLRLDPCIALWTGSDIGIQTNWSIEGDVYAAGNVVNFGLPTHLDGDVFSPGPAPGAVGAHKAPGDLLVLLARPSVTATYFNPEYTVSPISSGTLPNNTTLNNPQRIWHRAGDLTIGHNVTVEGMLLVTGNLTIAGTGSKVIAGRNVPALYTGGNLVFRGASNVQISGLAVVDGNVFIGADSTNLSITGGLFAKQKIAETAIDASGQGNDAVLYSQPMWRPAEGHAGAMEFDGVDDYLQTSDNATHLQLWDQYTLSLWVKPAPVQKSWAALLCKAEASGTPPANHWVLQLDTSATILMVYHGTATSWDTGISLAEMANGDWHHVAIVRQADGTMVSYFDNLLRKTLDAGDPNQLVFKNRPPDNGNGHLNIGADRTASPDYIYQGLLDDIRIYDCALDQADIDRLYNMGAAGAAAPIGYWRLDETGSSVAVTADPAAAAIVVGPPENNEYWSPAAGGFFRSIRRE